MRMAYIGITLILLAAIGAWAVRDSAPETAKAVEGVERGIGVDHAATKSSAPQRIPIPQATNERFEQHELVEITAVQSCLELKTYKDCMLGMDLAVVSPREVARILELSHIEQWARTYFLSQVLLAHGPRDFSSFCEEVFANMSGRFNERASWFEGAVHSLNRDQGEWLNQIGNGVLASEIFSEGSSDLMVVFLSNIEKKPELLDNTLRRGAQGEFGGTPSQVSRAYLLYMNGLTTETPAEAFLFAERILESPHLSDEASYSIAQDSLFCVSRLSRDGEVAAEAVEGYLNSLLRSPRFQVGTAAQFLADYSNHPFPGIEESVSSEFLRESQRVMDSR